MLELVLRLALGGILAAGGAAKLASPASSRAALSSFGVVDPRAQAGLWVALIAAELALAAGVIAGAESAALAAAALMALFAATMVGAIMRGRAGAPCACFGVRSTVGWRAVARNLALAGAFASLPLLPRAELNTEQWLGLGLVVALLLCLGLAIGLVALAREVGMLRLRLGPDGALEIESEGPPVGTRVAMPDGLSPGPDGELALAVFSSPGCRVCEAMKPAIAALARDPSVDVAEFAEHADAAIWKRLGVPGSPYAIALERDGTVLAKGAFSNLAQLESVLATAARRRGERSSIEALGA